MSDQDSPLSVAANIIGILTFVFAILAGAYARWIWLAERISPEQFLVLLEKLIFNAADIDRMARSLDSSPPENFRHLLLDAYHLEIDIGMHLLQFQNARKRITLWREVQALAEWQAVQIQTLRNEYLVSRLEHISWQLIKLEQQTGTRSSAGSQEGGAVPGAEAVASSIEATTEKSSAQPGVQNLWRRAIEEVLSRSGPGSLEYRILVGIQNEGRECFYKILQETLVKMHDKSRMTRMKKALRDCIP